MSTSVFRPRWSHQHLIRRRVPLSRTPANFTLTAEAGSYALNGQDAQLLAQYRLDAEQGTYTLTGIAADFAVGFTMEAEVGVYSLSWE